MTLDPDRALETVLATGDEWQSWRALRLGGDEMDALPAIPAQHAEGGFVGPAGKPSPGATGENLCHLVVIGQRSSGPAAIAADWLEAARTPARAWLDDPADVPGVLETAAGARVWATAAACCGLLAVGRDPGHRAIDLLRGEADQEGRFTGGAYPTFAAAGVYWLLEGPKTEMAEWGLRWAREWQDDWWGPWERVTALTFWAAAGVPPDHQSVEQFIETLRAEAPAAGWSDDVGLTLRTLEVLDSFGER